MGSIPVAGAKIKMPALAVGIFVLILAGEKLLRANVELCSYLAMENIKMVFIAK